MDIINLLKETRDETIQYFDFPLGELSKTYEPGKWNIKKILVHLSDAESVLHERIKRVIAEPKQVIWAFNQNLWCDKLDYDNFPLTLSKDLFIANRQSIIFLAQKYYAELGGMQFIHNETGQRTLKDEFDKVASHNRDHINQIKKALEG